MVYKQKYLFFDRDMIEYEYGPVIIPFIDSETRN